MRKEAGFNVVDRINLYYVADGEFGRVLKKYEKDIAKIVLAENVVCGELKGFKKDWEVNGETFTLSVEKI